MEIDTRINALWTVDVLRQFSARTVKENQKDVANKQQWIMKQLRCINDAARSKQSINCRRLFRSNWEPDYQCRALRVCIRFTCEGKPTWRPVRGARRARNSRSSSTIAGLPGVAPQALWRAWDWLVPTPCNRELPRAPTPMPPVFARSPPTKTS